MLAESGCDMAQGHLFSCPQPARELTEWLRTSPDGVRPPAKLALVATTSVRSATALHTSRANLPKR